MPELVTPSLAEMMSRQAGDTLLVSCSHYSCPKQFWEWLPRESATEIIPVAPF